MKLRNLAAKQLMRGPNGWLVHLESVNRGVESKSALSQHASFVLPKVAQWFGPNRQSLIWLKWF